MVQLFPLIVVIPLIGFWMWMFQDMTHNGDLPDNSAGPLTWPPSSKYGWTLVFIFMNVFGAVFYYFVEYRNRY